MKPIDQGKNPRWDQQRKKILNTASRLFWRKGYVVTTIDDIARAGRINKATIYYYFKNKAALLYEIACGIMQELLEIGRPVGDSNMPPGEKLKTLIIKHTKWGLSLQGPAGIGLMEKRNLPQKLLKDYISLRDEYEAIFRRIIAEGIEKNEFRKVDPKLYSLFILGLLNSFIHWYKPGGKLSPDAVAHETIKFIYGAIKLPET